MDKKFTGSDSSIVVAIKFNDHAPELIAFGADLSRRTGMLLELVTVTEVQSYGTAAYGLPMVESFVIELEAESRSLALKKLSELADRHASGVKTRVHAVSGNVPEAIIGQAQTSRAGVLVVGVSSDRLRFVSRRFSTALTLMAEASQPVIVVPQGLKVALESERQSLIFADNLSEQTEAAVSAALNFASSIGKTDFYHFHANALTAEVLDVTVNSATAFAHTQKSGLNIEELTNEIENAIRRKLIDRSRDIVPLLQQSGGEYTPVIRSGEVTEQLRELVDQMNPTFIVFGRHRPFRFRAFKVGHLPFHAMLEFHTPVVILPEEEAN